MIVSFADWARCARPSTDSMNGSLSLYSYGFCDSKNLCELATFTTLMLFYTSTGGSCLPRYLRREALRAVKLAEPAYGLQQENAAVPAQPSFCAAELRISMRNGVIIAESDENTIPRSGYFCYFFPQPEDIRNVYSGNIQLIHPR